MGATADKTQAELFLASSNAGKLRELELLLAGIPVAIRAPDPSRPMPEVCEDGETFEENAEKKAREVALALGTWVLADDSGLVVDALGGRPGVHSARYAEDRLPAGAKPDPAENNRKLLDELRELPAERRGARFECVVALADPRGRILIRTRGSVEGRILTAPRGAGGFGYDPLFEYADGLSFAEKSPEQKQAVSHRGRAMVMFRGAYLELLRILKERGI